MASRVGFISLGCPKNTVDSEQILSRLRVEGYEISPNYQGADLVIVNTCGFIDEAVEESLEVIGEALNENGKVIVTGCLGAKKEVITAHHPKVLAVTGPQQFDEVLDAVHDVVAQPHDPFTSLLPPGGLKLTPRHYAYLKISEGCNHKCSFCIIPSMRGRLISKSVSEIMTEAENLVRAGVKELLVVSQDTSAYGLDTRYRQDFFGQRPMRHHILDLTKGLASLGAWIRLHYVYPYAHVDDLVELMADERNMVVPYLDVPFQHSHPEVLRMMKRPASGEDNLERVKKWRSICPNLTIRSTFIVGFPGESEKHFEHLLEFIEDAQLDRVGCFIYSPVEGATANEYEHHVDEDVKQERLERFMQYQQNISAQRLKQKVGSSLRVIIDEVTPEGGAIGRSHADAPEVDGVVYLEPTESHLRSGQIVTVEITKADEYDLFGHLKV